MKKIMLLALALSACTAEPAPEAPEVDAGVVSTRPCGAAPSKPGYVVAYQGDNVSLTREAWLELDRWIAAETTWRDCIETTR